LQTSGTGQILATSVARLTIPASATLTTSGNFNATLTFTATTNSTFPAGTHNLAPLDSPVFTGNPNIGAAIAASLQPGSDSTTALQFFKTNGSTAYAVFDSTNSRMSLGNSASAPAATFTLDDTANPHIRWNLNGSFRGEMALANALFSGGSSNNLGINANSSLILGGGGTVAETISGANVTFAGTITTTPAGASAGDIPLCLSTGNVVHTAAVTCGTSVIADKFGVTSAVHGLDWITKMRPVSFHVKGEKPGTEATIGFIADEMAGIDPRLASYVDGKLTNYRDRAVIASLVKAVQELNREVNDLRKLRAGR